VKIVERLTKGESKKKEKNKSYVASYIVGGTSTFVTYDVTKVEVRWAESHLKLKSHAPKERGRLTLRNSAGLSCPGPPWALAGPCGPRAGPARPGQGSPYWARAGPGLALPAQGRAWAWPCWPRAGPGPGHGRGRGRGSEIFTFPIFNVFLVFHRFCIVVFVFHIVHMYFFETSFSWALS
jgi:hypothetical protein